jgi:hypothetical protein
MIENKQLTSLLIPSQFPEYIRDDPSYKNFTAFIQAYYEWMEENGNVTERTKNLLNYNDIDKSTEEFLTYFYKDFLSYFPEELLANKVEVVKLARELYKAKGTPASFQLLFRILYNSDVDFFYTKDAVFKPSSGKWYVAKSLKLSTDLVFVSNLTYSNNTITVETFETNDLSIGDSFTISGLSAGLNAPNGTWIVNSILSSKSFTYISTEIPQGTITFSGTSVYIPKGFADENFLNTNNLRIFGETTKTIATIENSVISGKRIEVFISNIERLFQSGEYIKILDSSNKEVYFLDGNIVLADINGNYPANARVLRAKILGQISQINIDPKYRGLKYKTGNPVVIYGGLNSPSGHGAEAVISETTSGSIQRIKVENGGFGYTEFINAGLPGSPNTSINIISNEPIGSLPIGALAHVSDLNVEIQNRANVSFIPIDYIGKKQNILIGATQYQFENNINANLGSTFANTFTFTAFTTYPISSVVVDNSGGGISIDPSIITESLYNSEDNATQANLKNLGILAPIQIINPGTGYVNNDRIVFTGGNGYDVKANVTSVSSNGSILSVSYVFAKANTTLGGMGYISSLPTLTIASANVNAANAVLVVPGILGDGATYTPTYNRVGEIIKINITDYGEDYIEAPKISLKIQDLVVNGIINKILPVKGDIIYQGTSLNSAPYFATVDSTLLLVENAIEEDSVYRIRTFNSNIKPTLGISFVSDSNPLIDFKLLALTSGQIDGTLDGAIYKGYDLTGILAYGDGTAKATASFKNGLTISQGQYLDSTGHPSSFDILQSINYNNFTYQITVEKEIAKYRKILLDLLHPTGMKVIGRYAVKSNASMNLVMQDALNTGHTLPFYTGAQSSTVTMTAPVSTNMLYYSSDFSNNTYWSKNFVTLSGSKSDPYGNTNAFLVNDANTTTEAYFQQGISVSPSSSSLYTISIHAKQGSSSMFSLFSYFSGNSTKASIFNYNFDTETIATAGADGGGIVPINPTKEILTDGWFRFSFIVKDSNNGLNNLLSLRVYCTARNPYANTGNTYFYGSSIEPGSFLSSYKNTTTYPVSKLEQQSTNIVDFSNLYGANLNSFISSTNSLRFLTANNDYIQSEIVSANTSANTVTLKDNVWLSFANVAYISANAGSNSIYVSSLTGSYDIINNGIYTNPNYPLMDIVRAGDKILIDNNAIQIVSSINYVTNIIKISSNLTSNTNSFMSVNRTLTAYDGSVSIFGPVGQQFYPEITDESGNSIVTEDGSLLILG